MDSEAICWEVLPKVSRSFALCIRILPKPLNEQMMISYLVYRVLDTIEDSSAPLATKKELFSQFVKLLAAPAADSGAIKDCKAALCIRLNYTYEKDLLENLGAVMQAYYVQPAPARRSILKWGRIMAKGMYEFQQKPIETFADQNAYSYHVAGVIGHLFTELLYFNGIVTMQLKRKLTKYARNFGLALQKVNILRDIACDAISNRCYWPSRLLAKYNLDYASLRLRENRRAAMSVLREQIVEVRKYLHDAMQYILLLPEKATNVRRFCLIPLFMAIESYAKCANSDEVFDSGSKVKISRLLVGEIVAKASLWGSSNERLQSWFADSMTRACPAPASTAEN
jgi:farnesyl-diphosphate farnesyltransferase